MNKMLMVDVRRAWWTVGQWWKFEPWKLEKLVKVVIINGQSGARICGWYITHCKLLLICSF